MEDAPIRQQSYLMWLINALGPKYLLLLPLVGLIAFVVVLILVLRGKGSALPAALILIVPLPLLVGVAGVVEGLMAMALILSSSGAAPKTSAVMEGVSMSLVTAWFGLILMAPTYMLATIGMFVRAMLGDSSTRPHVQNAAGTAQPKA